MDAVARLEAVEAIKEAKARYFRGVDTSDAELVRSILTEDCVLDYRGCCTDPTTDRDVLPAMNVVLRGAASWSASGFAAMGIVSVHQGHGVEIRFTSEIVAEAVWSMTDRLFMPPGGPFLQMTGYGYYHETYEKVGEIWKISRLRISRLRVETC